MASKKETEIVVASGYNQLANIDMATMMAEELDGLDTGFERIKIPSAESTVFEVPGEAPNEPEAIKEFSAVILYHHPLFAYYKTKYTGGNNPPDCGSFDGINGEGDPGGTCQDCAFNKFGTGENGSKACKNRRRISTYIDGYMEQINNATVRIHPDLFALGTATGRFAARRPNLQNMLCAGSDDVGIRNFFIAPKGNVLLSLDFSQIELRVGAFYCRDEKMLETYRAGGGICLI